ncbi:hypothetical protein [Pararhodospirillum oryzae]|uniref:Uncharacterized protein n=1 Tax=Pararhodospirillum oryzae TaxID=478448 RepID=A0A512H8S9_9PROT|nr:hypothetical protein [Pararhodospirillum oryzae]GEO81855.1 hypothetical protein ROR02_19860 [Pararhodospirillum oryzae]
MSTAVPPPLPSGPGVNAPVSLPTATVSAPPAALAALPPGSLVEATVLAGGTRGDVQIDTAFGPLILKTPLALSEGSTLALTLLGTVRGQAVLKIAALNGRSLAGGLAGGAGLAAGTGNAPGSPQGPAAPTPGMVSSPAGGAAPTPAGLAGPTPRVDGAPSGTPGSGAPLAGVATGKAGPATGAPAGIAATVVRTGAGAGTPPVEGAVPVGTRLIVRLAVGAGPTGTPSAAAPTPSPAAGTVPAGTGAPPGASPGAASAAPGVSPGASPPPSGEAALGIAPRAVAAPAGPGATASLAPGQGNAAAPSEGDPAARLSSLSGQQMTGRVLAAGAGARPLIETPIGVLALRGPAPAPAGTAVGIQIVAPPVPPTPPTAPVASPALPLTPGAGWPALGETLSFLSQTNPAAAGALRDIVPSPGPQMTAAAVGFLAATRAGGDLGRWPGEEPMRALERGGRRGAELANRLSGDLRDIASRPVETPGSEWRTHVVPFLNGATIEPIRVITRRPPGIEDEEASTRQKKGGGERFLIDITLSRLGPFQFDGFFQRKSRQLDLVVRTRARLPGPIRQDIGVLFNASLAALGLAGSLRFEAGRPFQGPPATPAPPSSPETPQGGLIA